MSGAIVCGTSDQARGLSSLMSQTMKALENDISSMEKAVQSIHGAWNDDGAGEVDEILAVIRNALKSAQDAMPAVKSSLEAYADFLDET